MQKSIVYVHQLITNLVKNLELGFAIGVKAGYLFDLSVVDNPGLVGHCLDKELVVRNANHGALELLNGFGQCCDTFKVQVIPVGWSATE